MVGLWGASSLIKSIQRGTITMASGTVTATATITSVDTANSSIAWLGMSQTQANANLAVACERVTLTNSTTVTCVMGANAGDAIISYEVIEYMPGIVKSVQRGTISIGSGTSATATVTEVRTDKSICAQLGWSMTTVAAPTSDGFAVKTVLTNATTITANRGGSDASNPPTSAYQLLEFF